MVHIVEISLKKNHSTFLPYIVNIMSTDLLVWKFRASEIIIDIFASDDLNIALMFNETALLLLIGCS